MGGTQFYIFNVRRKSRKKNSSTSFKLSTTPLRNAFHSLRETLAKFFFTFSPLLLRPNEKIDSLVHLSCINITLVESWMEFTATARRMRASPRFRSTLLASFFLLAVFFLTFWNRHGAERGSLTKVGNHTHRFHAIPVRSTRLQGGQVGRARVFLPFRGGTPRKYSRRSSLSRRMRMIDGTGNIFPLFHR